MSTLAGMMDARDVRRMLRLACLRAGSQKDFAARVGVSNAYICDVLRGGREPGPKICEALGVKRLPPQYGRATEGGP